VGKRVQKKYKVRNGGRSREGDERGDNQEGQPAWEKYIDNPGVIKSHSWLRNCLCRPVFKSQPRDLLIAAGDMSMLESR